MKNSLLNLNQVPTKYVTEKQFRYGRNFSPTGNNLPAKYCYKYYSKFGSKEEHQQDSDGDLTNNAVDDDKHFPQFVASSNVVTPKYLVHAKKL